MVPNDEEDKLKSTFLENVLEANKAQETKPKGVDEAILPDVLYKSSLGEFSRLWNDKNLGLFFL